MQFVIVGFGRVGMRTARTLDSEGHEVTIVENDPDKVARAENEGLTVVEGDGSEEAVLAETTLGDVDAIAGVTDDLNTNFAACMVGNHHGCRTVLRIDADYREEIYEKYAEDVDEVIYPERLGAAGAKTALLGGNFNVLAEITEELTAASVRIGADSPAIGTRVVEMDLPGEARIYAHGRAHEPMTVPLPKTEIEHGDSLAIIADPADVAAARERLGGTA